MWNLEASADAPLAFKTLCALKMLFKAHSGQISLLFYGAIASVISFMSRLSIRYSTLKSSAFIIHTIVLFLFLGVFFQNEPYIFFRFLLLRDFKL